MIDDTLAADVRSIASLQALIIASARLGATVRLEPANPGPLVSIVHH